MEKLANRPRRPRIENMRRLDMTLIGSMPDSRVVRQGPTAIQAMRQ
jgi:hypothetical protein